jgi:Flp pilus assembly protein TadG
MRASVDRYWRQESSGAAAVEFAIMLPLLTALLLGGYEAARLILTYRKLCDATAQLANIASQTDSPTTGGNLQTEMAAAAQVMYPDSTSTMTLVMSEIDVSGSGAATVGWSQAWNGGTVLSGTVSLPSALIDSSLWSTVAGCSPTTNPCYSYILVQSTYSFKAAIGGNYVGFTIPLSDQVYMPPRNEAAITCASGSSDAESYCDTT